MFCKVSNLLLPDRSGIMIVVSSFIFTNPLLSPLGEASAILSLPCEEITTKGDNLRNSILCFSNFLITFTAALPLG